MVSLQSCKATANRGLDQTPGGLMVMRSEPQIKCYWIIWI